MNNFAINIKSIDNILYISNLPSSANSNKQLSEYYKQIETAELNKINEIVLNLDKNSQDDLRTTAFLDSAIRFYKNKSLKVKLENIELGHKNKLSKIGIKCDTSGYTELSYSNRQHIPFFVHIGEATLTFLKDIAKYINFTGELFYSICYSIRHPRKVKWKETLYYMDKAGTDAVPIVLLLCFLLGAILAFQGIVQMGKFGLQIYTSNLVGLSIVKELGVLMVAMICIGRAGSAFAAEISTMKVNEEIDAMETMGLETNSFLVLPKMIALVCVMPLLTVIGNVSGIVGGMVVGLLHGGITLNEYYLRTISSLTSLDIFEGIFKSLVYAVLISGIACLRGFEAEKDAKGVGHAATSAVVSSLFLIVVADAFITLLLNQ